MTNNWVHLGAPFLFLIMKNIPFLTVKTNSVRCPKDFMDMDTIDGMKQFKN